jgi:hypothetical protein
MSIRNCGFDPLVNFWRHWRVSRAIPMNHRMFRGQSPTHRTIIIYGP